MGVAAKIRQEVWRTAKGGLGVDHPFFVMQRRQVAGESGGVAQGLKVAEEEEFSSRVSLGKSPQEETAEAGAEDLDGEQEFTAARDPAVMVGGQTAGGNDAVQVGMEASALTIP